MVGKLVLRISRVPILVPSGKFRFNYETYQMVINELLSTLGRTEQTVHAHFVDATSRACRVVIDSFHGLICEELLLIACIMQMGSDVFLALGQIKRWQGALDVDALFYGSVGWPYKLIRKR